MTEAPALRPAARVLGVDPRGRGPLFGAGVVAVASPPGAVLVWVEPGGQAELGGGLRAVRARELVEETGLGVVPAALEGPVWLRRAVAPLLGVPMDHRETYFVVRGVVHEIDVSGQTELEALEGQPPRWWGAEEMAASAERFAPAELAGLLPALARGPSPGPPRIVS